MAIATSTSADADVATAPAVIRHSAPDVSAELKPRTLSHMSTAAAAAAAAPIQASIRTLTHPGENTSRAKNSRTTITTKKITARWTPYRAASVRYQRHVLDDT